MLINAYSLKLFKQKLITAQSNGIISHDSAINETAESNSQDLQNFSESSKVGYTFEEAYQYCSKLG